MERGSDKHGPMLEDEMKKESAPIEQNKGSGHTEEWLDKEAEAPSGHRISGSGSSADTHPYRDRGEVGGASHPKPEEKDEPT